MKGLILTYVLSFGGAAVALFNPFVGVCVYWILDIVRPQYMFAWAGTDGPFSGIVAVAAICGWVFKGFGNWRFGRGTALVVLFVASGLWAFLSALVAPHQDVAFAFVIELLKRTTMFILAVTLADTLSRVRTLAWVVVGSAAYLSLELNLQYLAGFNEVHERGYGGMDNNSIAISLVTCLGLALFLGLYSRPLWQKAAAFASAAVIGHTVLLTFSRGGMLGMVVAIATAFIVSPKRPRYLLTTMGAIVLGLTLAGPEVRARFLTSFSDDDRRDYAAQSRVDLWMDCLRVIGRYPVLGVGPDHFPLIAEEFGWPSGKEAHSLWLQLGAETGVPGLAFLALFYALTIKRLWPLARHPGESEPERWVRHGACMVVSSLAGYAIAVQFVTMEGLETPLYVAAIAVGTLRLVNQPAGAPAAQPVPAATRTPRPATRRVPPPAVVRARR